MSGVESIQTAVQRFRPARVSNALGRLNAQWRSFLAASCELDTSDSIFQAVSADAPAQAGEDVRLSWYANRLPSDSPTGTYDTYTGGFAEAYRDLLLSLLPQDGTELAAVLGGHYSNWTNYRRHYYSGSLKTATVPLESLFGKWAERNLGRDLARRATTVFAQARLGRLNRAMDAFQYRRFFPGAAGQLEGVSSYSAGRGELARAMVGASSRGALHFDSATASDKTGHAWADERNQGLAQMLPVGDSAAAQILNRKAEASRITLSGEMGKLVQLPVQPLGWFDPRLLQNAFAHPGDHRLWDARAKDNWHSLFASPGGRLRHYLTSLVIASDYTLTLTIHNTFSPEEFALLQTDAHAYPWPFRRAHADLGLDCHWECDPEGALRCHITAFPGGLHVLGMTYRALTS